MHTYVKDRHLRSLLEEGSYRLTHSSHLSEYIPVIYSEEKKKIKEEIEGRDFSVILDGSARLGEPLAIVLRFFSQGCIKQRLVKVAMLSKLLSGEELARELLTAISTDSATSSYARPCLCEWCCYAHTIHYVPRRNGHRMLFTHISSSFPH